MANMNERDSKVHVTITHKREKKKPKYNFSVVMSGLLITSTLLASFSGLTAHAAGLDTDYASNITNPTPIVATYQREASSKVTSLLNTSYEELLLISNKINNDGVTLKALLSISDSLNDANYRMDSEDYNASEVIALATMIRTALEGVDTNLSQSGYDANSSQRVLVTQMQNTINEINAKAGNNLGSGQSTQQQTPSVKPMSFSDFNWNNPPMQFTDVPSHQWYYNDVSKASASGIINGIGNNQFNPNGTLTHAEAMTLMAKVHAIYQYGNPDVINDYSPTSDHWASGIYAYCQDHSLPTPKESDFDTNISRGTMARYFRQSLPSAAFKTGVQNDLSLMPEQTNNQMVQDLFRAGILIGDNSGFRLEDSITRAEAAAIIHRVANPDVRVKVEAPETQTPVTPEKPSNPGGETVVTPVQPGQVQTSKPYKNIPHTNWQSDPTGGVTIQSQSGYINTKYGNHTYGCKSQEEYDKVMSVMDEAYNYACQQEANRAYRGGQGAMGYYAKGTFLKFCDNELGYSDKNQVMSLGVTGDFVGKMQEYLYDNYAKPNGNGINTDAQNNNVYKWLFGGGHLDCDGDSHLYMLCYDYLGFSTRMIGSYNIKHACAQVYVNGEWVLVDLGSGRLDKVTHSQIKELMQGIKNDAYDSSWDNCDLIVATASNNPDRLSDLTVDFAPTHAPNDRSL